MFSKPCKGGRKVKKEKEYYDVNVINGVIWTSVITIVILFLMFIIKNTMR